MTEYFTNVIEYYLKEEKRQMIQLQMLLAVALLLSVSSRSGAADPLLAAVYFGDWHVDPQMAGLHGANWTEWEGGCMHTHTHTRTHTHTSCAALRASMMMPIAHCAVLLSALRFNSHTHHTPSLPSLLHHIRSPARCDASFLWTQSTSPPSG